MKIHQEITESELVRWLYQVKALDGKARDLSSHSGTPMVDKRTGSHRLASDFPLWHTLIHLPNPSKIPKSENEYTASLHFKATQ